MPTSAPLPRIVAVVGPTATGKSALALRLAEHLGGEIVNADALQVYRGLDIGTAKPTPEERRRVPHHLVDLLEPTERWSAGVFARQARRVLEGLEERGCWALVVGGSGFYLRALFEGLSPLPPAQPEIRGALRRRADEEGSETLHRELAEVDPAAARRLDPGDRQRVVRALEVWQATGTALSTWIERRPAPARPLSAIHVGLTLPRPILYDRIADRVVRMVERGWVGEVQRLLDSGVPPTAPAFQAIGYRQMLRHVRGELDLDQAIDQTAGATRRFAKRQMTWFRKEPLVEWFDPRTLSDDLSDVLQLLEPSG